MEPFEDRQKGCAGWDKRHSLSVIMHVELGIEERDDCTFGLELAICECEEGRRLMKVSLFGECITAR